MNQHNQFKRKDAKNAEPRKVLSASLGALCIFAIILPCNLSAKTAMELFNPAAREYIVGNTPVASNLVHSALEKHPDDEKLQKLKKLIEQQQQDQQDQQNQDQQDQQNQQDPSDKSDPSDSSNQNQEQQQDQNRQEEQDNQQQEQKQPQEQEPQEAQPAPAQPQQAGQMSEEEAEQLLDAMKLNEKDQRSDLRPYLGRPVKVDKDW